MHAIGITEVVVRTTAVNSPLLEDEPHGTHGELGELIQQIQKTTGLKENPAKTVVYFAAATHGVSSLDKFPILTISGPAGTGKTTLLSILEEISHNPVWIDGKVTKATLRDSLKHETTALVDEADEVHEEFLMNRYSRQSGKVAIKVQGVNGWVQTTRDLFGATALHRRIPYRDPAVHSRSIVISTQKVEGVAHYESGSFDQYKKVLETLGSQVAWKGVVGGASSRIRDTWGPLQCVAEHLSDESWLTYAEKKLEEAERDLELGHEIEPTRAVFLAFLSLALEDPIIDGKPRAAKRVALADIKKRLQADDHDLHSWQVGVTLRTLGFETGNVGGIQYAFVGGFERLVEVANELGVKDEMLND